MSSQTDFQCVIVGGGLVGTALAIALAPLGLSIALIEPKPPLDLSQLDPQDYDRRAIALSQASVNILKALNVWQACAAHATAIQSVKISEKGRYGKAQLNCADQGLTVFGQVIAMSQLQAILESTVATLPTVSLFRPERLITFNKTTTSSGWQCQLSQSTLHADCLIACDGSRSFIREQLNIPTTVKKLTEVAVLANVTTLQPMNNTAYERFTADGPVALLPIGENQATAVITTVPEQAAQLIGDENHFLHCLQTRFGYKLGRFLQVGDRQQHPLIRCWAERAIDDHVLLLGNAAHTLHPVAAQGFNLSLRDVAVFAEIIADSVSPDSNIDWQSCLQEYQRRRAADQAAIIMMTERVLNVFSLDLLPSRLMRGVGLQVFNHLPLLKQRLTRLGMGLVESGSKRLIYGQSFAPTSTILREKV